MKKIFQKILCILLILTFFPTTWSMPLYAQDYDGTATGWAKAEIDLAVTYGLTYDGILSKFTTSITREEFSTIAVKLYEKLTGTTAPSTANPFTDTANPEVLKAYAIGIVKGKSATLFAPTQNITRQELCVMIYRALDQSNKDMTADTSVFPFNDIGKIDSWAIDAMKFAYAKNIMKGKGAGIDPLNFTTREEAIVLLKRTYEQFKLPEPVSGNGTVSLSTGTPPSTNEQAKFKATDFEISPYFTQFDQRVNLFVATTATKPTSLLTDSTSLFPAGIQIASLGAGTIALPQLNTVSAYTQASYGVLIDKNISSKRWFSFSLTQGTTPAKIVYQISHLQFDGYKANWKAPLGLVTTGELSAATRSFEIDFSTIYNSRQRTVATKPIENIRETLYIRVIPLDGSGNPLGDPGKGISVLYGSSAVATNSNTAITTDFQLWTPAVNTGTYSKESADLPKYAVVATFSPKSVSPGRIFEFVNLPESVTEMIIQVSTKPFPSKGYGYTQTENLIYENKVARPNKVFPGMTTFAYANASNCILVPFLEFGEPAANLKQDEYIKYYVRGVALVTSDEPGKTKAIYSQPITVSYGYSKSIIEKLDSPYNKFEKVNRSIPELSIQSYTPMKLATDDYLNHYYVYRAPSGADIQCNFKNNKGETLIPYVGNELIWKSGGILSPQDYESKVLPYFLPVGANVYFPIPDPEKDKAWYEELLDGIISFFEDLIQIVGIVVTQVKAAYDGIKDGLINYIAYLCPAEYREAFKKGLKILAETGMIAMGLPPTLPDFNQLLQGNLEYLAQVALTESGIPAGAITDAMISEAASAISDEITQASNHPDPNPINSNFLKLDPSYGYRPAYVTLTLSNPSAAPTIPGTMDLNVQFIMNNATIYSNTHGLYLETPVWHTGDLSAYSNHFKYGLNGNTVNYDQGEQAIYEVFTPITAQKIPILQPKETQTMILYLAPYDTGAFPRYTTGQLVAKDDFNNMYFNNGSKLFTHFSVQGYFPQAREFLGKEKIFTDQKTFYYYESDGKPISTYQKPVNTGW